MGAGMCDAMGALVSSYSSLVNLDRIEFLAKPGQGSNSALILEA